MKCSFIKCQHEYICYLTVPAISQLPTFVYFSYTMNTVTGLISHEESEGKDEGSKELLNNLAIGKLGRSKLSEEEKKITIVPSIMNPFLSKLAKL